MVKDLLVFATALLALTAATATTASAQATATPAERFVLSGVVAYDDGDGKAWLQEPRLTGDRVVLVRRGDSVGPWRVTAILRNRVELQGPGGTVVVPLHNAGGTAVATSGAPAASAPSQPPSAPSVPLGDPSRREAITQFMDFLKPGGAGSEAPAPAQTAPRIWLPEVSTPPTQATEPPKTIYFGKGDPRRREGMRELFGPR
jgi:hypothetical protein